MKIISCALAAAAVFSAAEASAQTVNLTGAYRCIEACQLGPVGSPTFVVGAVHPDLGRCLERGCGLFA
jgi:hypothetical protein